MFDTLTSTATDCFGINDYFIRRFGPDHPNAKRKYAQGDIVSTVVRTKKGKSILSEAGQYGHGGTDYLELKMFVEAVRNRAQTPIDVYESVIMSANGPLSEESIAKGGAPVKVPDFTRGKWKTRKPRFALDT